MSDNLEKSYLAQYERLRAAPEYVLRYFAIDLYEAGEYDKLYHLLVGNKAWMDAKFSRFNGDAEYVEDIGLALKTFTDAVPDEKVIPYLKLHLARCIPHQKGDLYDNTDLKTLIYLGDLKLAVNYARMRVNDQDKFDGVMALHRTLSEMRAVDIGLLRIAYELATNLPRKHFDTTRAIAFGRLAKAFAEEGNFSEAFTAAREINISGNRDSVLCEIATQLAKRNELEDAWLVLEYVDKSFNSGALYAIAEAQAKTGAFSDAFNTLAKVEGNEYTHIAIRRAIATELHKVNRIEEAKTILSSVEDDSRKLRDTTSAALIFFLSETWFSLSDSEQAKSFLREAITKLEALSRHERTSYRRLHLDAIRHANDLGVGKELDKIIESTIAVSQFMDTEDYQAEFLFEFIDTLVEVDQFEWALVVARSYLFPSYRTAIALSTIASSMVSKYNFEEGHLLFKEAETLLNDVSEPKKQLGGLRLLALNFAKARLSQDARRILDFVVEIALKTSFTENSSLARMALVDGFAGVLRLETQLKIIDGILDEGTKAHSLTTLTYYLVDNGRVDDALEVAKSISHKFAVILDALGDVAMALAVQGRVSDAINLRDNLFDGTYNWYSDKTPSIVQGFLQGGRYDDARRTAYSAPTLEGKVASLRVLAGYLIRTGDKEEGAKLREAAYRESQNIKNFHARYVEIARLGYVSEAITFARKMTPSGNRTDLLRELALILCQSGLLDEAVEIAQNDMRGEEIAYVLRAIAEEKYRSGKTLEAQKDLENIWTMINVGDNFEFHHVNSYGDFIRSLIKCHHYDLAEEVFNSIPEDIGTDRYATFRLLVQSLVTNRELVRAMSLVRSRNIDVLLYILGYEAPAILNWNADFGTKLLREIVSIAGWIRPDWAEIDRILASEAE